MERLNKKQREILNAALKGFPNSIPVIDVPVGDFYRDVKILEDKGLVTANYTVGTHLPVRLTITPKGIEKLQETFTTRLMDTAYNNPWVVLAIVLPVIVSLILGSFTLYYYYENLDLQNQIKQENELKQIMPPTVSLTQEFRNSPELPLEIIPTLYFKKNSDRLFTIANYEINVTLNGEPVTITGGGYKSSLKSEGIIEGKIVFPSFWPEISYNKFNSGINDLVTNYSLEIKNMDSQIVYRGTVTTEINYSIPPKSPFEPIIFKWTKV